MNLSDLLKLFSTETPWMISLRLLFLASVIVDPRRLARVSATLTVRSSPASMPWSYRTTEGTNWTEQRRASSCCRGG
jgi:hypothetical protein